MNADARLLAGFSSGVAALMVAVLVNTCAPLLTKELSALAVRVMMPPAPGARSATLHTYGAPPTGVRLAPLDVNDGVSKPLASTSVMSTPVAVEPPAFE